MFRYSPEYVVHAYNQYKKMEIKEKYDFTWETRHRVTAIQKLLKNTYSTPLETWPIYFHIQYNNYLKPFFACVFTVECSIKPGFYIAVL